MHEGDFATIPMPVGVITRRLDDDLSNYTLIVSVVLWEKRDLSDDAVTAGFNVYSDALENAITANLLGLASTEPTTKQNAINAVKSAVHDTVYNTIESALSDTEKVEIELGILTPDSTIDNSSTTISMIGAQSFQITFGNTPDNRRITTSSTPLCNSRPSHAKQNRTQLLRTRWL
jgi:hypothetical protein